MANLATRSVKCECFSGFAGLNCSIECNGGAFNPCSYNGDCNLDGRYFVFMMATFEFPLP
ncbi:hypothetical protein T484DRAFT_1845566 [Baffinella frigidus]|nr:hypothetical protein T484DRAFT_1845566 [Cryptophyta sp. CCMP2293]